MKKKLILFILVLVLAAGALFAADESLNGLPIKGFAVTRTKNILLSDVNDVLYLYREKAYSEELLNEIIAAIYKMDGVAKVTSSTSLLEDGTGVKVSITLTEYPKLEAIEFSGYSKVKKSDLEGCIESVKVGQFINLSDRTTVEKLKQEIVKLYYSKGFDTVPVDINIVENLEKGTVSYEITVQEGVQSRIVEIAFEGNDNVSSAILMKQIKSRKKGLFSTGYLNANTIVSDCQALVNYYLTIGYVDVKLAEPLIEDVGTEESRYRDVKLTFVIAEGDKWQYGGMTFTGNNVFTNEEISALLTVKTGSVLNLQVVQNQIAAIAEKYYDNGYIRSGIDSQEIRDEENHIVSYALTITEGNQCFIEKINIEGLKKTKEYVMRRELQMKEGDIFSRANLITSAQNLYNTGLLKDLDYNLTVGSTEESVILTFILTEGSHIDLQFGATFGASVSGFPISGFLQWSEKNFGGRAQTVNVSTTISPTTQRVSLSFGDNWVKDLRWANTISLSFSRVLYSNELQLGIGSEFYNGRDLTNCYPLGYSSAEAWKQSNFKYPSASNLMDYTLYTISLAYNTGYTFIYNSGRLSVNGGTSISLNHADYSDYFTPYEKLIYKYGSSKGGLFNSGWQFSNSLSVGATWDGRDYITNTTKGYVVSANATYAGGVLGGLSNYIKLSGSAAGYLKLLEVGSEENRKNIMLSASTSVSFMLPQYYNNPEDGGIGWHDPKLGATKYEMLYIDGMTTARGFSVQTDKYFMWDNMLEVSYPLAQNIVNAEVFTSATGVTSTKGFKDGIDWYLAAGAGLKLKVSGFPLGLYLVKNFTVFDGKFESVQGALPGGTSIVLAISTSLI